MPEFLSRPSRMAPGVTTATRRVTCCISNEQAGSHSSEPPARLTVAVQKHIAAGEQEHGLLHIDVPVRRVIAG